MAYQLNDNSGSLFLNDKKQTANHPDFTGKAIVGGKLCYISAWLKTSKGTNGVTIQYYSLAFKLADAQQPAAPRASFPAFPQFGQQQAPVQQAQIFPGPQAPTQAPAPAPAPAQTMPSFQNEPAESPYPEEAPQGDLPF